jgi:hypothetical protein
MQMHCATRAFCYLLVKNYYYRLNDEYKTKVIEVFIMYIIINTA